jgi:hypothetical protein
MRRVVARRNSMLMVGVYLLRIQILVVGVPFGRSGRASKIVTAMYKCQDPLLQIGYQLLDTTEFSSLHNY